jgi:hypothetical protein
MSIAMAALTLSRLRERVVSASEPGEGGQGRATLTLPSPAGRVPSLSRKAVEGRS